MQKEQRLPGAADFNEGHRRLKRIGVRHFPLRT
jgi:hypothetical protein